MESFEIVSVEAAIGAVGALAIFLVNKFLGHTETKDTWWYKLLEGIAGYGPKTKQ